MKKEIKKEILSEIERLSDEELEGLFYACLNDCLGSEVDDMIELGFCETDIRERRQYERFLSEKCGLVENACFERGIELFKS